MMTEEIVWQALQDGHITLNEACLAVDSILRRRYATNSLTKGVADYKATSGSIQEKAQTHSSKRKAKRKQKNDTISKTKEVL